MTTKQEPQPYEIYQSLFHYTNEQGLYGILANKSLWATHYRFLNDSSELQIFKDVIALKINKSTNSPDAKTFLLNLFNEALDNCLEEFRTNAPVYLSCFCPAKRIFSGSTPELSEEENFEFLHGRLSQWRNYGKDGGYAIEFDTKLLDKLLTTEYLPEEEKVMPKHMLMIFGNVIYYAKGLERTYSKDPDSVAGVDISVDNLITLLDAAMSARKLKPESLEHIRLMNKLMNAVITCAVRIKHYGFHEENEVRIGASAATKEHLARIGKANNRKTEKAKEILFRPKDNIPYIKLFEGAKFHELFKNAIKSIVIGPGYQKEKREVVVQLMLKELGYDHVATRCSDIPLV